MSNYLKERRTDGETCCNDDESLIRALTVPIPYDEGLRLRVLRETGLLDSDTKDPNFDRFTSLCQRLFNVCVRN